MKPPEDIPLPPHAYVPGRNARHEEEIFAAIHDSVRDGMGVGELTGTLAWRAGWHYIQQGYFWEAHEALEPVWMALPEGGAERQFVQAVIQTANAALKLEMARPKAARRLCAIVRQLLAGCGGRKVIMDLPVAEVTAYLETLEEAANL